MNISKKSPNFCLQPVSAACLMLFMLAATNLSAAPLNLTQVPAGNGGSEPAPNVILSIDDSGSMGWDVNGCQTVDWRVATYGNAHEPGSVGCGAVGTISANPSRISSLRAALRAQFGDGTANSGLLADDRIRLAWQAMHNNGAASNAGSLSAGNTNAMKRFSGTHRTNFNTFITSLTPNNGTPAHKMMSQAYNYMKSGASLNSPWASNPGTTEQPYLACRRSYHIFMTDGAWNGAETGDTNNGGNAYRIPTTPNFDGSAQTLPSPDSSLNLSPAPPTSYTPNTNQTRVYSDAWGAGTGTNAKASTLADYAFRSWAEDLQPSIPNAIQPLTSQTTENVPTSAGNSSTPLQPFWNPKNDPATWQHLTQHTIGFGNSAVNWTGNPLWNTPLNSLDDTYGGAYGDLVNGIVTWQNPIPWFAANGTPSTTNDANTTRQSELWHAALNGRGKFYPARSPATLSAAFRDILNNIISDTSNPNTGIQSDGASLSENSKTFQAGYDAKKWSGRLKSFGINQTTGALAATATWSATGLGALDANNKFIVNDPGKLDHPTYPVSTRLVTSFNGTAGIEWKTYSSLPSAHQLPMSKNNSGTVDHTAANNYGQKRVDYIRGDRSNEQSETNGIFRNRDSRLGDIINSKILYLGKPVSNYGDTAYQTFKRPVGSGSRAPMLYVGANDGMLHGFDAATGVEKLAYIPQGIAQGDLRKLTDPTYTHQYFVDGTPFAGDAKVGTGTASTNPWRTVLASGLGAGGKGYFALDVTNQLNFTAATASSLVIADTTASTDPDIGNMFITPAIDPSDASRSSQIVRLNSNNAAKHRWALVVGNGYNSTNEAPVLIVQYLDGANDTVTGQKEIKKVSPCISVSTGVFDNNCAYKTSNPSSATSNGLSTPRLVDLNDDGIADVAYAGDLLGNVWKFDLSSKDPSEWKTSYTNEPLFKAKTGQSFTTAPYVEPNFTAGSGVQIHISSGRNLTLADQTSNITETTYSLWDNSRFGPELVLPAATPPVYKFKITDSTRINTSNVIPTTLIEQTISTTPVIESGNTYYTSSSNSVNYERASGPDRGWFMDWKQPKQRVLRNSKPFDGQKISIYSTVPSSAAIGENIETCTPGLNSEKNFLTIVNMFTGKPSKAPTYDLSNTIAAGIRANTTTVELPPGDFTEVKTRNANGKLGGKVVSVCKEGQVCKPPIDTPWGSYVGLKAGWHGKQ
jgi:type IV pilus assembly protein PilY1